MIWKYLLSAEAAEENFNYFTGCMERIRWKQKRKRTSGVTPDEYKLILELFYRQMKAQLRGLVFSN